MFEGLLNISHEDSILNLLFRFAHWHGLAKLCLHSELSLAILDKETTDLGDCLRDFQDRTCASFNTQELQREKEAWERRSSAKAQPSVPQATVPVKTKTAIGHENPQSAAGAHGSMLAKVSGHWPKTFKLSGYKAHAMGDYVLTIRRYGTTDSYSTKSGELEHCWPKGNYKCTSKKEYKRQLAHIERRQARLWSIKHRMDALEFVNSDAKEVLPADKPALHHQIGALEKLSEDIHEFLKIRRGDPAIKDFVEKLKTHLCPRIKEALSVPSNASPDDTAMTSEGVFLLQERLYHHKIMWVNYTTYDARHAQDIFNPRTSPRD
ncbi:hypothetical protein DXG01_003291, partial [Tephrocybe rancida]